MHTTEPPGDRRFTIGLVRAPSVRYESHRSLGGAAAPAQRRAAAVVAVPSGVFALDEHVSGDLYGVLEVASLRPSSLGPIALTGSPLLGGSGTQEREAKDPEASSLTPPRTAGACGFGAVRRHHDDARR
jgi:hypothetical protein